MNRWTGIISMIITIGITSFCTHQVATSPEEQFNILSYEINTLQQDLKFYWKDDLGVAYGNFENLKSSLAKDGDELVFAMNGGMYTKDQAPQGLYIENGETLVEVDRTKKGYGNFYLQPNGIFYLEENNKPVICRTDDFKDTGNIKYATQSGPMLLVEGEMHPKFNKGSSNLNIRNGVGILPNGNLVFGMSKGKINFYDFATYFKLKGCRNALYLDGFVSKVYLPAKNWEQMDGGFGVMMGETKRN